MRLARPEQSRWLVQRTGCFAREWIEETNMILTKRKVFTLLAGLMLAVNPASADTERTPLMGAIADSSVGKALDSAGIELSGWVEMSAPFSTTDQSLLPQGFPYRANEFSVQQNWIRLERTTGADRSWGFRSDWIAPGTDYRFTIARGLLDDQLTDDDGSPERYGFDPVQFYAEWRPADSTILKLGRLFAPYGAESIEGWSTPLPSRSYSFIYNPFTQTGLYLSTPLGDSLTFTGAVTAGNDVFLDDASQPTVDLGVTYTSADKEFDSTLFFILGESQYDDEEQFNNPGIFDIVTNWQITKELKYTLELVGGLVRDVPEVGTAKWLGAVQYLRYQLTPTVEALARFELFADAEGNRTGTEGTYVSPTVGLGIRPYSWLLVRPELRFDHQTEGRSFEGSRDQFTATVDALVRW